MIATLASERFRTGGSGIGSIVVGLLGGGLLFVGVWLLCNQLYFHSFAFWKQPAEHQIHLVTVLGLSLLTVLRAARVSGSTEDRIQQVLLWLFITFGALAFVILVGRLFYSRTILSTLPPATLLLSVGIIALRRRRDGVRSVVIAPLAGKIPEALKGLDTVHAHQADLRRYDIILVDLHEPVSGEWSRALSRAMMAGCRVRHIHDHLESYRGAVEVDRFELEHLPVTDQSAYVLVKRLMDILGAMVLLIVLSPLMLLAGLLILLTMGWPIFFVQDRTGLGGAPFRMWKFRTMRPERPGEGGAAVPGDRRVTRLGRILRRLRIDELPQLFQVLAGQMSLIGPRPEATWLHDDYTDRHPAFAYRCLVRSGITGWAQVNAPPSATADEAMLKLSYDLYYVKRQSLTLDLQIAIRTVWTILHGAGVR